MAIMWCVGWVLLNSLVHRPKQRRRSNTVFQGHLSEIAHIHERIEKIKYFGVSEIHFYQLLSLYHYTVDRNKVLWL